MKSDKVVVRLEQQERYRCRTTSSISTDNNAVQVTKRAYPRAAQGGTQMQPSYRISIRICAQVTSSALSPVKTDSMPGLTWSRSLPAGPL